MDIQNLPLLEFFTQLQRAGLPLGIDEYQLMLHALQGGFGLSDQAALKSLCRTLWVKSADDGRVFDYHFEQVVAQFSESEISSQTLESSSEQPEKLPNASPSRQSSRLTTSDASPSRQSSRLTTSDASPSRQSSRLTTSDTPPDKASEMIATSKIAINVEDEVQVAQAVLQATSIDDEIRFHRYISSDEYFPVTRRQMKQSWRYLRRPIREGPSVELDVEATVNEIGREGILLEPMLVPRRINRAELLLMIDYGGSMVPFHMLSYRLIETVLRGGRLGRAGIYYFHNCPIEYLYRDPAHMEYEEIEEVLNSHYSQWAGVLVFSDAGAARGGYSPERIGLTEQFLKRLKQQFRYIAWLNPMPRSRWPRTTAVKVMQSVPMFDLSRRGLDDAISVLRGRPILRHEYYE